MRAVLNSLKYCTVCTLLLILKCKMSIGHCDNFYVLLKKTVQNTSRGLVECTELYTEPVTITWDNFTDHEECFLRLSCTEPTRYCRNITQDTTTTTALLESAFSMPSAENTYSTLIPTPPLVKDTSFADSLITPTGDLLSFTTLLGESTPSSDITKEITDDYDSSSNSSTTTSIENTPSTNSSKRLLENTSSTDITKFTNPLSLDYTSSLYILTTPFHLIDSSTTPSIKILYSTNTFATSPEITTSLPDSSKTPLEEITSSPKEKNTSLTDIIVKPTAENNTTDIPAIILAGNTFTHSSTTFSEDSTVKSDILITPKEESAATVSSSTFATKSYYSNNTSTTLTGKKFSSTTLLGEVTSPPDILTEHSADTTSTTDSLTTPLIENTSYTNTLRTRVLENTSATDSTKPTKPSLKYTSSRYIITTLDYTTDSSTISIEGSTFSTNDSSTTPTVKYTVENTLSPPSGITTALFDTLKIYSKVNTFSTDSVPTPSIENSTTTNTLTTPSREIFTVPNISTTALEENTSSMTLIDEITSLTDFPALFSAESTSSTHSSITSMKDSTVEPEIFIRTTAESSISSDSSTSFAMESNPSMNTSTTPMGGERTSRSKVLDEFSPSSDILTGRLENNITSLNDSFTISSIENTTYTKTLTTVVLDNTSSFYILTTPHHTTQTSTMSIRDSIFSTNSVTAPPVENASTANTLATRSGVTTSSPENLTASLRSSTFLIERLTTPSVANSSSLNFLATTSVRTTSLPSGSTTASSGSISATDSWSVAVKKSAFAYTLATPSQVTTDTSDTSTVPLENNISSTNDTTTIPSEDKTFAQDNLRTPGGESTLPTHYSTTVNKSNSLTASSVTPAINEIILTNASESLSTKYIAPTEPTTTYLEKNITDTTNLFTMKEMITTTDMTTILSTDARVLEQTADKGGKKKISVAIIACGAITGGLGTAAATYFIVNKIRDAFQSDVFRPPV